MEITSSPSWKGAEGDFALDLDSEPEFPCPLQAYLESSFPARGLAGSGPALPRPSGRRLCRESRLRPLPHAVGPTVPIWRLLPPGSIPERGRQRRAISWSGRIWGSERPGRILGLDALHSIPYPPAARTAVCRSEGKCRNLKRPHAAPCLPEGRAARHDGPCSVSSSRPWPWNLRPAPSRWARPPWRRRFEPRVSWRVGSRSPSSSARSGPGPKSWPLDSRRPGPMPSASVVPLGPRAPSAPSPAPFGVSNPALVLFAGGPEATADPRGLLAAGGFDFAVVGEGEVGGGRGGLCHARRGPRRS